MSEVYDSDVSHYDELGRPVSGSGEDHGGQVRMAYRLAGAYVDRLLHVHGLGWHRWDGRRWAPDESGYARRAVLDVLRSALSASIGDKQLRGDVAKCESASGIDGVLTIASALVEFAATVADLDADPYLLNTASGTLDMRTRSLRQHDPRDRITKVTTGAYDPQADPSVWGEFLAAVLPDEAVREYLRRVLGQAIYGAVREHLFPVLIGTGANGKGTAYGALTYALGDYATIVNPDMLMASDRGGIGGPEMMQLLGARLVVGSETEDGRRLDTATMKRLTGGDELTARHLYRPPVTWRPSHQFLYVTNSLPTVKGDDPAVWRRVRVVPFDVVVPESDRDPELPERLTLHADAILTWAVQGWFDYLDHGGMHEPASVLRATDDYKAEGDDIGRFIDEACETGPFATVPAGVLYAAWQSWAAKEGVEHLSAVMFAKEMDRRGFEGVTTSRWKVRQGIRLAASESSLLGEGGG